MGELRRRRRAIRLYRNWRRMPRSRTTVPPSLDFGQRSTGRRRGADVRRLRCDGVDELLWHLAHPRCRHHVMASSADTHSLRRVAILCQHLMVANCVKKEKADEQAHSLVRKRES